MNITIAEDESGDLVGLYVDGVLRKSWCIDSIDYEEVLGILGIPFEKVEIDQDWLLARKTGFPKNVKNLRIVK